MADVPSEAGGVSLVVRSPAQRHQDFTLPAERTWTVRRLKAELRRLHPDQPPEDTQRLIYSGKLLQDHAILQEVLTKELVHVLHLVCSSKTLTQKKEADTKNTETVRQPAAFLQNPPGLPSGRAWAQRENSCDQPPAATTPSERSPPAQPPFQGMNFNCTSYTAYSMLQFWFHQIYARQYYMQYMAANAASGDVSSTRRPQEIPVAPVAAPAPLPGPFPAENENQPGNQDVVPPPPVNPGINQNLRLNAQGGALMEEEEEGGGHRDWLDWLYSVTLFYVFVNLVYFYSSFSRFLMVMAGTLLMYLHRAGWFPFSPRRADPARNDVPAQAAVNQDQNNNLQEGDVDGQEEAEVPEFVSQNQPGAPSFISTACLFFKTFFTSLLPEAAPPVVAN